MLKKKSCSLLHTLKCYRMVFSRRVTLVDRAADHYYLHTVPVAGNTIDSHLPVTVCSQHCSHLFLHPDQVVASALCRAEACCSAQPLDVRNARDCVIPRTTSAEQIKSVSRKLSWLVLYLSPRQD